MYQCINARVYFKQILDISRIFHPALSDIVKQIRDVFEIFWSIIANSKQKILQDELQAPLLVDQERKGGTQAVGWLGIVCALGLDPFGNSMPLHLSLAHTPLPRLLCELMRVRAHA